MRFGLIWAVVVGCGGSTTPTDDGGGGGRCGAVTSHDLSLQVQVDDADGVGIAAATVRLEERNWEPGVLGEAETGGSGAATLADLEITSVEGCWGVAVDYVLVVEKDERSTEVGLNSSLFAAVSDGESSVQRTVVLD